MSHKGLNLSEYYHGEMSTGWPGSSKFLNRPQIFELITDHNGQFSVPCILVHRKILQ